MRWCGRGTSWAAAARRQLRVSRRGLRRSCRSTQVTQDAAQGHFRLPGLKPVLHRGADLPLDLRATHALGEQVGIATEILNGRERDRVDTVLDHGLPGGRKPGNPMSERPNEISERV